MDDDDDHMPHMDDIDLPNDKFVALYGTHCRAALVCLVAGMSDDEAVALFRFVLEFCPARLD